MSSRSSQVPPLTSMLLALEEEDLGAGRGSGRLQDALLSLQGARSVPEFQEAREPFPPPVQGNGQTPGWPEQLPAILGTCRLTDAAVDRRIERNSLRDRLELVLPQQRNLEAMAQRVRNAGHRTAIVCGASPIGRLAASCLAEAGVEVLALTDRTLPPLERRGGRPPVLPLETGLALSPGAAVVSAIASSRAVIAEILALSRKRGAAPPEIFPFARM